MFLALVSIPNFRPILNQKRPHKEGSPLKSSFNVNTKQTNMAFKARYEAWDRTPTQSPNDIWRFPTRSDY